ncbi:hypothetical protein OB920_10245 [Halobacteria archaeon HArc-gm2]|nr:hypothetical protein [Halobacteria archaeon HArc-gm2]
MMRKPSDSGATDRGIDRHLAAVSHPHRLSALRCLARADSGLHLADLARDIARREGAGGGESMDDDAVERIYVDLYHLHLPKLCEAGVVSFDAEARLASMAVDGARVQHWVATGDHRDALDAVPETAE